MYIHVYTKYIRMRKSSYCLGPDFAILGGIHPSGRGNSRYTQCTLSASAFVMYAVASTIVLPSMSKRLWTAV